MTARDAGPSPSGAPPPGPGQGAESIDDRLEKLLSFDVDAAAPTRRRRRSGGTTPEPTAVPRADPPTSRDAGTPSAAIPSEEAESETAETAGSGSAGSGKTAQQRRIGPALAAGSLVFLLVAGVVLAYAGTRIVRASTSGEVLEPIADPDEPGFEAVVDATPTLAVLHDLDGLVDAITVLTLPNPSGGGGGVITIPTRTIADLPLLDTQPIEAAYDLGNAQFQAEVVGDVLHASVADFVVVDRDRWADLTAPVAPLVIDNPNRLFVDGELRFDEGEIRLDADEVAEYLEVRVEGESDLARLFRHELLWLSWLDAVAAASGPDAVPGEVDTGIGRFVRTLAAGDVTAVTLPVQPSTSSRFGDEPTFVPRLNEVRALVAELIPLPRSPRDGARARTRVLNGTVDHVEAQTSARIAAQLPPANVEVSLVGNAPELDHETTTISYFGAEFRREAIEIAEILGVEPDDAVVEDERPSDVIDITVTLGADHG